MFTPFAFIKSPAPVPLGGLVAWYDAADYVSGSTTWPNRVDGPDLTLLGTYSRSDSVNGPYVWFETLAHGYTGNVINFLSNDITIIQLMIGYPNNDFDTSWAIAEGEVSNFIFTDIIDGQSPVYPVGVWHNGNTGYYASGSTPSLSNTLYPQLQSFGLTTETFYSYRVSSGFDASSGLQIKVGDNAYQTLGGGFTNTLWRAGAFNTNYDIVGNNNIILGAFNSSGFYPLEARYGVYMVYNRLLSDEEIQTIYDYYADIYNLLT